MPTVVLICLSLLPALGLAQQKPYAAINRDAVSYNGPGRDAAHDLAGPEIRLGLLAPLAGTAAGRGPGTAPRRGNGHRRRKRRLPARRPSLALVARDESGPWGQASSEIVHLVFDDQAVALITSTDGGAAHLAEQVANKIGVPILTLSSDTTTTEINLPWIFRMGPTDAVQARVFARDIYQNQKLQHVALLTQDDHDGRAGGEEFEIAARELNAASPQRIIVEPDKLAGDELRKTLEGVQARRDLDRRSQGQFARSAPAGRLTHGAALPIPQGRARGLEQFLSASLPGMRQRRSRCLDHAGPRGSVHAP